MSKRIDLTGQRFGKLVALRYVGCIKTCSYWWVRCDCGTEKRVDGRALRPGRTISCRCRLRDFNKAGRLRPYEGLYNLFVRAATVDVNKGLSVTYDDFFEFTKIKECYYCKAPINWIGEYSAKGARYNLDRKDNGGGYTVENCVVCCTTCNFAKGARYSHDEWKVMADALRKYRERI